MKRAMLKTVEWNLKSMRVNFLSLFLVMFSLDGWGALPPPPPSNRPMQTTPNRPTQGDDINATIRQLRTGLSDLRNEVKNHESEIRMFEERLHNQENSNEHMRQELTDDFQSQKDFSKAIQVSIQNKLDNLEIRLSSTETQLSNLSQTSGGVMNDLRQLRSQANDSIAVLGQYKQKLSEVEEMIVAQNQHIANLEAALQSIMELIQAKPIAPAQTKLNEGNKIYKVQPGDSLEKIARANHISIQQLKDYNQLSSDRIIVGQTLKIP
jgi:LysM repeat protein